MSKYTKGPWRVLPEEIHRDYIRIRGSRLGERYKIANVLLTNYAGIADSEVAETRANANLIAAAPTLLETLTDLVTRLKACGPNILANEAFDSFYQEIAEEAIRQATRG